MQPRYLAGIVMVLSRNHSNNGFVKKIRDIFGKNIETSL